jgi:hypothetical protein
MDFRKSVDEAIDGVGLLAGLTGRYSQSPALVVRERPRFGLAIGTRSRSSLERKTAPLPLVI